MNKDMMGYCGTYCETCDWKEKFNCLGCKAHKSEVFWGKCKIAACAMAKDMEHCGNCSNLPCDKLQGAYDDPEHGDNGERLINLKCWAKGEESKLKTRTIKA